MPILKTPSFQLAVYTAGDKSSEKLALLLPGRLDTKDYAHMRGHVDFLATKGYFALSFDPPGTWESPGAINLYTTHNYVQAINELIEFYGNKPTLVMGHSRGGSMAILAALKNPHITHIITLMSHYGPSSVPLQSGPLISYRDLPPGDGSSQGKKRFDLPYSFFEDSVNDDYSGLENCTKPKLFFLGTHDDLVTPQNVKAAYELAAQPKQLYELDYGHDYRRSQAAIKEVNSVVETFLQHNGDK